MNILKNLFSKRKHIVPAQPVMVRESITQDVKNAIGSCYDMLCSDLKSYAQQRMGGRFFYQDDIERELWVHFANLRLSGFEGHGQYHPIFDPLLNDYGNPWYKVLDLVEYVCKWIYLNIENYPYLEDILRLFEKRLNFEFDRLDFGYRVVNHCITDITSEEEQAAIQAAIDGSKDNIKEHLSYALEHYSKKPTPDVRASIKESISAVEALCREYTGLTGDNGTLGKALKKLEDNGIVLHRSLKEAFEQLYTYSNSKDSGIRHALMDPAGTYVPSKDEAYLMLIQCSAFINYLRMKMAKSK